MTWTVKKKNNSYLVMSEGQGSFIFNNRVDAERLCDKLNSFTTNWSKVSEKLIEEGEALIELGNELKKVGEK